MPACIEQGSGSVLNASDMAYISATSSANCPPEIHLKSLFSQGSCTLIQGEEFQYTQKYRAMSETPIRLQEVQARASVWKGMFFPQKDSIAFKVRVFVF